MKEHAKKRVFGTNKSREEVYRGIQNNATTQNNELHTCDELSGLRALKNRPTIFKPTVTANVTFYRKISRKWCEEERHGHAHTYGVRTFSLSPGFYQRRSPGVFHQLSETPGVSPYSDRELEPF